MLGLRFTGVTKRFNTPAGKVLALENLDLHIPAGQFVVIVGPNGSGKSTLLNLVAGIEHPDSGAITGICDGSGRDWAAVPRAERSKKLSRVYQDPTEGTADELTVVEHLRLSQIEGVPAPFTKAVTRKERGSILRDLASINLVPKLDAMVEELSGGQRQLLALEMAGARRVDMLLLDEPTASLDRRNAAFCLSRIEALHRQLDATVLFVTHDIPAAARVGERLVVLQDGRLKADISGRDKERLSPEDIFRLCELETEVC